MTKNEIISLKEKIALLEEKDNKLVMEKQRLTYLLAASPAIIYSFEAKNYLPTFISENIKKILGYEPSEYLEDPRFMPSHIHPDDIRRIDKEWSHLFKEGHHVIEYRFRCKDGSYCWINDELRMIHDKDGEPLEIVGAMNNINARKKVEEELAIAKDLAEQANQAKSSFLANMSQLRTPMNAILGYSEMLMEEAEDLNQNSFIPDLKKIHQSGSHLLALINGVLDLSKIESGKMEAFAEYIDLDMLIDEASAISHPLLEKNNNSLTIVRSKGLGLAHQDMTKLRQILFNLLSNAAKFTHEGTITLDVNSAEEAGEDWLTIEVSDTGIGIAEDKIEHVFEEFAQADDSTTRDYGGTGLGLAISRRFSKLLGGDLTLHSKLGEGTKFTVRIPAILPGTKPQMSNIEVSEEPSDIDMASIRDVAPGSTILVIDDDEEACEIIERFLVKDGFNVVTANSGKQGLQLAHELQPAAITLDVMMPSMDGWTVLRTLKADPELHNIPVIEHDR